MAVLLAGRSTKLGSIIKAVNTVLADQSVISSDAIEYVIAPQYIVQTKQ